MERAHATLKNYLQKIKKGEYGTIAHSPQKWLSHALFILNFLILDNQGKSAADRHWHPETKRLQVSVKWKDPLTAQWYGPDPVLIWGRGHVSIFSQKDNEVRWLPERLVRQTDNITKQPLDLHHDNIADRDPPEDE